MPKYQNIISLGFFCSPAIELNYLNLRKSSQPFDWVISSNFNQVLELIDNNFKDFLNPKFLFQLKQYPQYYRNIKYNIDFYHDFDELKSFNKQIDKIKQKYDRRIKRFYNTIKEPTLFLRYICSKEEAIYINNNYEKINKLLKSYNANNDIIFVANKEDLYLKTSSDIKIWYVEKDNNDDVARHFLRENSELKAYILKNVSGNNISPHKLHKKSIPKTVLRKFCRILHVYYHHKQTI